MNTATTLLRQHQEELSRACRRFGVRRLELFGSATRDDFNPGSSDLDFIVSFANKALGSYADRYLDFALALEQLFGRPVDVITERSLQNPSLQQEIAADRQVIYEERVPEETARRD